MSVKWHAAHLGFKLVQRCASFRRCRARIDARRRPARTRRLESDSPRRGRPGRGGTATSRSGRHGPQRHGYRSRRIAESSSWIRPEISSSYFSQRPSVRHFLGAGGGDSLHRILEAVVSEHLLFQLLELLGQLLVIACPEAHPSRPERRSCLLSRYGVGTSRRTPPGHRREVI